VIPRLALLFSLASGLAHAQLSPIALYKKATRYEFLAEFVARDPVSGKRESIRALYAFSGTGKYRVEGAFPPGTGSRDVSFDIENGLAIHDGSRVWFYLPKSNQFGSIPVSDLNPDDPGYLGNLTPPVFDHLVMWRYRGEANFGSGVTLIRQETIEYGGTKIACFVLAIRQGERYTWWVDKNNFRILREDTPDFSVLFRSIKLGEQLPDRLFIFQPPPGAKKLNVQH